MKRTTLICACCCLVLVSGSVRAQAPNNYHTYFDVKRATTNGNSSTPAINSGSNCSWTEGTIGSDARGKVANWSSITTVNTLAPLSGGRYCAAKSLSDPDTNGYRVVGLSDYPVGGDYAERPVFWDSDNTFAPTAPNFPAGFAAGSFLAASLERKCCGYLRVSQNDLDVPCYWDADAGHAMAPLPMPTDIGGDPAVSGRATWISTDGTTICGFVTYSQSGTRPVVTPSPTSMTVPQNSWPMIRGGWIRLLDQASQL